MRFIIGFLVTIGLLIIAFVIILSGGRGSDTPTETSKKLMDYANSSVVVRMTTIGPVQADQTHNSSVVTIGRDQTTVQVFKGYQESQVSINTAANNQAAYADFLRALDLAQFTKGNKDKAVADERGYCAQGERYVFSIKDGDKDIQRFWYSSCGVGTFKGQSDAVRDLFKRQIIDFDKVTAAYNK